MQKKIDSLNATIADKDKQLVELSALKTEAETLRAQNKELEDKLVKNSGDKKSIDALNQKIKNLQAENAKLTGQIKQSTVGSGDVDKIAALTKENEDLKSQIETLKQVQKTGSLGAQDAAELISLRKENADLKQQLADLETQLKAASNGKPVSNAKMQHDMQAMAHENMELKERLAKYEHASPASEATVDQTSDAIPAKKSGSVKAAKAPVKTPKHKTDDVVAVAPKSVASPKDDEDNLDVPSDVSDAAVKDDVRSVVEDDAESEAQREEAKMRDSLKTPPPAPAVAPKAAAKSASDDKPVEVHASQDPFAPIKADNDVKSYESVAGAHPKAVAKSSAPGREDATEAVPTPVESESIPPLDNEKVDAPKVAAPPVAKSVDKTDDAGSEKINWNKPPATSAAVAKPVTSSSVKMPDKGVYQPEFSVKDVLNKAQLVSEDNVKLVPKASNANKAAWQWKTGDVYGSAEQTAMPDAEKFDGDVKEYLDKTQKRCSGDFAIEPDNSKQLGDMRLDSYEIACVGKGVNSSASLLFIGKDGTFTAMAHEAPADKMSDAMNIRDKLMKLISGS